MTLRRLIPLCLTLLAMLGAVQSADAGESQRRGASGEIVLAAGGMSLDQAVAMVEKRFKARVVRTEVRDDGGRKVYVLRLLNDAGRVWTVRVDASSGAVM